MRAGFRLVLAALLLVATGALAAHAEKRIALVVGNGDYAHAPKLDNPANDAKLIGATLQSLGFTLVGGGAQIDLDRSSLERMVRDFGRAIGPGTVALFYYSGHGLQIRGTNYLVPVQANLTSVSDVDFELIDLDVVVRQMDVAHASLNLIILDACRNNPFGGRGLRDGTGGLAEMHAPRGTLISYATQPGGVARDGEPGGDSPYTVALAQALKLPGVDVFKAFNQVGLQVSEATSGNQVPWLSSSPIEGEFYLASAPAVAPRPEPPPPPATPVYPSSSSELDALFWHSIEGTNRPEELQAYLRKFPDGIFADLARTRLALLQIPHPAPPPVPPPAPAEVKIGAEEIGEAQRLLLAMGISRAPVSGRADARLGEALRIFQRVSGQAETGVLTPALLEAMRGPAPEAAARAAAVFGFAVEAARAGRAGDAIALYDEGLKLDPDNADAQHALAELRKPPVRPVVQRPVIPAPPSRQTSLPPTPAPAPSGSGFYAIAADGRGRQFRSGNAGSEGAAVSSALASCHAASGDCRIVAMGGRASKVGCSFLKKRTKKLLPLKNTLANAMP